MTTSERSRHLDAMTEEDKQADILASLAKPGSFLRIEGRQSLGFWGAAVAALEGAGKITVEFVDLREEQCSYYKLRLRREGP